MASGLENIETIESPFRRFVTTIGVFPTAFTDAMTYYECLAYLVKYLEDTVIPAVNENAEALEELQTLFIQLKTYVDDYFTNLDVQTEINNKLDKMAQDGSFQPLLDLTFREYYDELKAYTDNNLESKVDKDGTGQVTYNNLSQAVKEMFTGGNTAVVGTNSVNKSTIVDNSIQYQKLDTNGKNGVAGFNQKRYLNLDWENGTRYTDGTLIEGSDTITNTEPITFTLGTRIKVKAGYKIIVYSWTGGTRAMINSSYNDTLDYLIGTAFSNIAKEFYITVKRTDNSDITPSEGIDAVDVTEIQSNIKPSYFALDTSTQKMLTGKTSSMKIVDSYSIGNPISSTVSGFSYSTGPAATGTSDGRNRAWLNTPIFLPTGATLSVTNDWELLIIKASSVSSTSKVFYPSVYTDNVTVQDDDVYYIGFRKADNSALADVADQFTSYLTINLPVSTANYKVIYVSGAGNDTTGDGSSLNPYRQITKALTEDARVIICDGGYKYNKLDISNKSDIKIIGKMPEYSTGDRKQVKPYFDNSIALTDATLDSGRIKIPYVASENTDMYDCLVAKTKDLKDTYSTRSDGYFCTIFSEGDKDTAHRYIPVLTQDSVAGHFYYDGSYIYINPYSGDTVDTNYSLVDSAVDNATTLVNLSRCNNITFENFEFKHCSRYLFYAEKCNGINVIDCELTGSSQRDNLAVNDTNINITNSISYLARNDGFNFHGFGTSVITKCIGCNCFDDGISHHDQCTHSIIGGEYYGNGKGGIASPTYGCSGDIIGCYTHHNPYGIYSESNPARGDSYVNLNNNLIVNNDIGIRFNGNVTGVAYNNKLSGNSTNLVNNSSVVVY